ncbi:MAG: alpha/beta hydrolase [Clostridiales Family XIII bacterium]|nr:alpha/beta hydrolase [Clostridiales Family XIII bacterium]
MSTLTYILIGIAIVILLLFIVALILAHMILEALSRPIGEENRRTYEFSRTEQEHIGEVDFAWYDSLPKEAFTLPCEGADLACIYIPNPGGMKKCLIRAHGYTQNHFISVRYIDAFYEMGYSIVLFDQRYFGESTGERCTFGYQEKYDLLKLVTWARAKLGADAIVGVHGESMGGITALTALCLGDSIDFVVSDCAPSDFYRGAKGLLRHRYRLPAFPVVPLMEKLCRSRGFSIKDIQPAKSVGESNTPILFIHGDQDSQVPVAMVHELYAASKNPLSRLEIFPGAEHGQSQAVDSERYKRIERAFVNSVEEAILCKKTNGNEKA